jgi:hypothetical protein
MSGDRSRRLGGALRGSRWREAWLVTMPATRNILIVAPWPSASGLFGVTALLR